MPTWNVPAATVTAVLEIDAAPETSSVPLVISTVGVWTVPTPVVNEAAVNVPALMFKSKVVRPLPTAPVALNAPVTARVLVPLIVSVAVAPAPDPADGIVTDAAAEFASTVMVAAPATALLSVTLLAAVGARCTAIA